MRVIAIVFPLLLLASTPAAWAQSDGAGAGKLVKQGEVWENARYQVKLDAPEGWTRALDEPRAGGRWVDLVRYEDPKTGAAITLSAQASRYLNAEEMIDAQSALFKKDASLAVLREEVWGASKTRPKGIFFEYSYQGKAGTQHAVAAFWLFEGRRYRVYGTVREAGWRVVSADMDKFVGSVSFTGVINSDQPQNYVDEALNFAVWFPDGWRIRMPASGPRVVFSCDRPRVSLWVYAYSARGDLEGNLDKVAANLEGDGAQIIRKGKPYKHPAFGIDAAALEYTRKTKDGTFKYRETVVFHRNHLYRIILAASEQVFEQGTGFYTRMVDSLSFMR
jgi:hypothetical protein